MTHTEAEAPNSLYRQVLGTEYELLAPELQIFHGMAGRYQLSGVCSVSGAHTMAGRLIGWIVGLPKTTVEVPLCFDLQADTRSETWHRHFPARPMISRMRVINGMLVERLGPVTLHFHLQAEGHALRMVLRKIKIGILSCPHFLMPSVRAEEHATSGKLHFNVAASLPLAGLLVAYHGYLKIPMASEIA